MNGAKCMLYDENLRRIAAQTHAMSETIVAVLKK